MSGATLTTEPRKVTPTPTKTMQSDDGFAAFSASVDEVVRDITQDKARATAKRRQDQEGWLFPGHGLLARCKSRSSASVLVGDLFESISESVTGADRLISDSGAYTSPDLEDRELQILCESKATQRRCYFKIPVGQLLRNRVLMAQTSHTDYRFHYYMWAYKTEHLSTNFNNFRDIITAITSEVLTLDVLDITVLQAMHDQSIAHEARQRRRKKPDRTQPLNTCHVRKYDSWKGHSMCGPDDKEPVGYHALQIGHRFLAMFRENPKDVLLKSLLLEPQNYAIERDRITNAECVYQGVEFPVNTFDVFRCVRK